MVYYGSKLVDFGLFVDVFCLDSDFAFGGGAMRYFGGCIGGAGGSAGADGASCVSSSSAGASGLNAIGIEGGGAGGC